ncbi:hypothetical protein K7X08_016191 [Anisodus acutangulus]|uniref:FHA domain-containing protein n=1 Tax=Anisodus acutangulus TaxID=402998 RepID=A0A9Q1LGI7_9SOLA|nr:hypothetical protein K7X08_016191 [Anisodus acutangulus]
MGRSDSRSPARGRGSPRKRSPLRRERSPARERSSHAASSAIEEKPSSRNKSPRRARSRSPVPLSPAQERPSSRNKSPKRRKSISPTSHSPIREKPSSRTKSPKRAKSRSPYSKLLQGENSSGRARMVERERREKKSGKDAIDNGSHKSRNGRSDSPSERQYKSRHRSRSPAAADSRAHAEATNSRRGAHRNGEDDSLSKMEEAEKALEAKNKDKPSFELSGKLAAETNRVRGITLLFNEPPDARKPDIRWRLYVFKGGEVLNEPLYVHRQSCYLFGRERRVADIPTDHPSCSKQHAVLQYRQVEKDNLDGTSSKQVRPYVMDLGSTNGTFINETRIESERYYELFEKDTLKFGNSSREYVLLHENSA